MKYLLDVNALLARAHVAHAAYRATSDWMTALPAGAEVCTCSIVEIGFLRVAVQARLQPDIATARRALADLKVSAHLILLSDDIGAAALPAYVTRPAEITDGHLLALARRHGAKLATLDTGIPGALLITAS